MTPEMVIDRLWFGRYFGSRRIGSCSDILAFRLGACFGVSLCSFLPLARVFVKAVPIRGAVFFAIDNADATQRVIELAVRFRLTNRPGNGHTHLRSLSVTPFRYFRNATPGRGKETDAHFGGRQTGESDGVHCSLMIHDGKSPKLPFDAAEAVEHLRARDAKLGALIERAGAFML